MKLIELLFDLLALVLLAIALCTIYLTVMRIVAPVVLRLIS